MEGRAYKPEELLGPLNEVESRNAPEVLYAAGRVKLLHRQPRVSVIGSRESTSEGLEEARGIAACIVCRHGVVVSGLAKGVDTAAHRSAMEHGGDTIAVLGTPMDRAYPKENEELQRELMERQLVLSEFSLKEPTSRKNFVLRNRTMALVSHASIIVEAEEASGAQHQGWEALRLGRILLLPQRLVSAGFAWPRKMLHYGALVYSGISNLEPLLDEFLPASPVPSAVDELGEPRF